MFIFFAIAGLGIVVGIATLGVFFTFKPLTICSKNKDNVMKTYKKLIYFCQFLSILFTLEGFFLFLFSPTISLGRNNNDWIIWFSLDLFCLSFCITSLAMLLLKMKHSIEGACNDNKEDL